MTKRREQSRTRACTLIQFLRYAIYTVQLFTCFVLARAQWRSLLVSEMAIPRLAVRISTHTLAARLPTVSFGCSVMHQLSQ